MNQSFLFFELIGIFIVHWLILEPQTYVVVEQFIAENIPLLSGRLVQNSETTTAMYRHSPRKLLCPLKDGSHQIFKCEKFKKMSTEERHINVKALGLCFNCLSQNHLLKDCLSKSTCRINNCNQRHNTLLH